jgi:hypothetical protein
MDERTPCFRGVGRVPCAQNAETAKPLNGVKSPIRSEIAASPPGAGASPMAKLEYIADMVQELKIMSAQADCEVLADLLGQAYREAVRQSGGGQ